MCISYGASYGLSSQSTAAPFLHLPKPKPWTHPFLPPCIHHIGSSNKSSQLTGFSSFTPTAVTTMISIAGASTLVPLLYIFNMAGGWLQERQSDHVTLRLELSSGFSFPLKQKGHDLQGLHLQGPTGCFTLLSLWPHCSSWFCLDGLGMPPLRVSALATLFAGKNLPWTSA